MLYTKNDIKRQLSELGIRKNDTLLIHTSYKAVGEVEGGPNGFIDAFSEYLDDGNFIIPTHTWDNVNRDQPIYNVNETLPCIGLIPRIAAFRKDGIRSLHPTHSVWVRGKDAREIVQGEELAQTPAPVGGAWWRLGEMKGKILLIGVGLERDTYIHAIDEIAGLDDRLMSDPFTVTVIDNEGKAYTHPMRGHHNAGSDNFGNFEAMLKARGAIRYGRLCDADVRLIDAALSRDLILSVYSKTNEHLCLTRKDIPEELWK